MIRKLFLTAFLVFLPFSLFAATTIFDTFNTHQWYDTDWSTRKSQLTWTTFDGKTCLKVTTLGTSDNWAPLRMKMFAGENWQNVELLRMDIYMQSTVNTIDMKVEVKNTAGGTIGSTLSHDNLTAGTWTDCVWDVNTGATNVGWFLFFPDGINTYGCTYYIDNVRLVMTDHTTQYWDTFDHTPNAWAYDGSTVTWTSEAPDVVTNNVSSTSANAGSGYLQWQYNGTNSAAFLKNVGMDQDWSNDTVIKADVWCSTTTIPLLFAVWYGDKPSGDKYAQTGYNFVTAPETWQTLYWPLPQGTTSWHVTELMAGVLPNALCAAGTFYIDNITILNASFGLNTNKTVAPAQGKPGDEITITIPYTIGDLDVNNFIITEALPSNSYLSGSVDKGSADSVQYYVNGAWQGSYDASATKIRWTDNVVPGGSSGLSVSYKVKVK